jgi:hypothetical protein
MWTTRAVKCAINAARRRFTPLLSHARVEKTNKPTTTTLPWLLAGPCRELASHVDPPLTKINVELLEQAIIQRIPEMAYSLVHQGYYCTTTAILPLDAVAAMRAQAIQLRKNGRFEPSWSEKTTTTASTPGQNEGLVVARFVKEGVLACEPDGGDYDTAPDLVTYMSVLLQTLPTALKNSDVSTPGLSASSFNAKLAVTLSGGYGYPRHVDNPLGISVGDTRKLTCILYLNPDYGHCNDDDSPQRGGELRLLLGDQEFVDILPTGGRLLLFWSDEIPHEVLPTAGEKQDERRDRYALTVWIPTDDVSVLHSQASKFRHLADLAFP